ncbi:MAG: NlpC/P60 family protein [Betaproteobacteria bacterium]|nr:NlpC/P60 family protein [Betaproteobacteria bacterium]
MFVKKPRLATCLTAAILLMAALAVRADESLDAKAVPAYSHPAVELAHTLIGIPYRWAGSDPARGFDCSGLVYYIFNQLQIRLPRMPRELFHRSEQIGRDELKPGDLLFFHTFARLSHVGIYIGEGRFIHAPRRGQTVRIESMDSRYYQKRYAGARRVMEPSTDSTPKFNF